MALTDKLKAIADAIRGKTGKTDGLTLDQMPGEIASIETGGGGGSIEHIYTVDYTPAVNTKAFTVPIDGFLFPPVYVDCRAVTEVPRPTGLQGAVCFSVFRDFRTSADSSGATQFFGGTIITKKPDNTSDYWNFHTRVTATDKELIVDASEQNNWEMIAGVTYRFLMVEGWR